jgi:hypothetical protein
MKGTVLCKEDMYVSGRLVFEEGSQYYFSTVYEGKKAVAFNIKSESGVGYASVKDPMLSRHFKKRGEDGYNRLTKKRKETV